MFSPQRNWILLAIVLLIGTLAGWDTSEAKEESGQHDDVRAKNESKLEEEVAKLRKLLAESQKQRRESDILLLVYLDRQIEAKTADDSMTRNARRVAKRLAPTEKGNRLVWRVLISTRTLHDGLSLAEAKHLLGPPTNQTSSTVGWYFNPNNRHVAPFLRATIDENKATHSWRTGNR